MSSRLPARQGQPTRADVLRQQFAPDASDADLTYFAQVAHHMGVDPWAGHLCLIPYRGVYKPQLTVAGRRFIAQRTGRLRGIVGPEYCGPRQYAADGSKIPLEWEDVWDQDGPPYAARVLVMVEGWDRPSNGTVKWDEFVQTTTDKRTGEIRPTEMWRTMPAHMLGKCAESLALRRAFSEVESAVADLESGDATGEADVIREAETIDVPALTPDSEPTPSSTGPDARRKYPPSSDRATQVAAVRRWDDVPDWVRDRDQP